MVYFFVDSSKAKGNVKMKPRFYLPILISFLLVAGCAHLNGEIAKKSALKEAAVEATTALLQYYQAKDVERFMTLVSPKFQGGYGKFEEELTGCLTIVESVAITAESKMVETPTEGNLVTVETDWEGVLVNSGGVEKKISGKTKLIFIRYDNNVLKLYSTSGDDIFFGPLGSSKK
jgi:hypothetical protein